MKISEFVDESKKRKKPDHALASDPPPRRPGGLRGKFVGANENVSNDLLTVENLSDFSESSFKTIEDARRRAFEMLQNAGEWKLKPEYEQSVLPLVQKCETQFCMQNILFDMIHDKEKYFHKPIDSYGEI
jgi:hypothetical protein